MSVVPTLPSEKSAQGERPVTMFGPDFPFAYDDWVKHGSGLGQVPAEHHGREVAVIGGGIAGVVCAYELMKLGLKPVIYEADEIGGRLKTVSFDGHPQAIAELGAMRFPLSASTFFHYVDLCGLSYRPFPNPLCPATPSTVVDLKGVSHYAHTLDDLPQVYRRIAAEWERALEEEAAHSAMRAAIRERDVAAIKALWNEMVPRLDDRSFYGFLAQSDAFASFHHRELFGQVGFGTGGWDTDFPNSILEILRVVYTGADDEHQQIVEGSRRIVTDLWQKAPGEGEMAYWPAGTSLSALHHGAPRPGVVEIRRTAPNRITITDADDNIKSYDAAVITAQVWLLLSKIRCDERLFDADLWTAIERTHYMQASKTFVLVDRPFWKQTDPETGRDTMSMTLTDRMTRGTYLIDLGDDQPGVICLSYTWNDDSLKWLPLPVGERVRVMLQSLKEIYPGVDIRARMIANPITVSWESEPDFMGAFKANLPGQYRYQRRLFTHFMQAHRNPERGGLFLAGDDISWTAGWAEGAVQTALNAVWGVMTYFGGATPRDNPGPGDRFDELAPLELGD